VAIALRLGLRLESVGGEGQREKRHREDQRTAHTDTVQRGAPGEARRGAIRQTRKRARKAEMRSNKQA
jgi:hypothetical protein